MDIPKTPFTILALAPLAELPDRPAAFKIVDVDRESLDAAVDALAPTLAIAVPQAFCPEGFLYFKPAAMTDFKPHRLAARVPYLASLAAAGEAVDEGLKTGLSTAQIAARITAAAPNLPLDLNVADAAPVAASAQQSAVDDLLAMVAAPGGGAGGGATGAGDARSWRKQIDGLMSALLGCVYADEGFRRLEAAWQGVAALVCQGPVIPGGAVSLKIASVSRQGLAGTLETVAGAFSQVPPNLILLDMECDATDPGIERLDAVLTCADTLMVPTAVWIGPRFFHLPDWRALGKLPYIATHLENAAYAKWRKRRQAPGSEWVAATLNRFLTRAPYGEDNPPRTASFTETSPLWVSPVWALGVLAAKSVATIGWPSRLTDYRSLSLTNLAVAPVDDSRTAATEALISEDRIAELIESGIIPLAGGVGRDTAAIPHEATLAGGSLKFQLFFNRLMGFLFELKTAMDEETDRERIPAAVTAALAAFFRASGQEPPADMEIGWAPGDTGAASALAIGLTPPSAVLPQPGRIDFTLGWTVP
ncbi:MAG: type VI secretion system contractile sheath large subunit [Pseudomonadota bacterium]